MHLLVLDHRGTSFQTLLRHFDVDACSEEGNSGQLQSTGAGFDGSFNGHKNSKHDRELGLLDDPPELSFLEWSQTLLVLDGQSDTFHELLLGFRIVNDVFEVVLLQFAELIVQVLEVLW